MIAATGGQFITVADFFRSSRHHDFARQTVDRGLESSTAMSETGCAAVIATLWWSCVAEIRIWAGVAGAAPQHLRQDV
jgi:hypothetical protein